VFLHSIHADHNGGNLAQELQEQREEFQGYLEQKERETADLHQQLQLKNSQIDKSLQEQQQTLQKEIERVSNEVQGELHEKQQQIEAQKIQIVQAKQDHEETLEKQIVQVKQNCEERIRVVEQWREKQIKLLEVPSQQQVERIEKQLERKELQQLNMKLGMPPFHFTMSNFNQLKTKKTSWYSHPMYTHTRGYKLCIAVVWEFSTHMSVDLYSMPGEFDATLQWLAKFTITLQLLNQHRDQDHITVTTQFQWKKPERGRQHVDYFTYKLIAHTDLELNAQKQTQYLKDDCLRFRITKIEAQ